MTELERRGITRAVSEYWLTYRVVLASDERIILGNPSDDRYPPYHDAVVAAGPDIAHVYVTGSPDEQQARPALLNAATSASRHWGHSRSGRRRAAADCRTPYAVAQNSVISAGGRSSPPVAGIPASSSRPRKITALRGAKSSRLLLKSA